MSLEALTFREELRKLDDAHQKLLQSEMQLRNFILSDKFLEDFNKFQNLLGKFQSRVISFIETVESIPQILTENIGEKLREFQEENTQASLEQIAEGKALTLEKALIIVATIVALGMAVTKGYLEAAWLGGAVTFVLAAVFWPQIKSIFKALTKTSSEKAFPKTGGQLESWVRETIGKIRRRYEAMYFLVRVQVQTAKDLPHYNVLGYDEVLYVRRKQAALTMRSEILSQIGEIIVECDRNLWQRKSMLIGALSLARQATASIRGAAP